MTDIIIVKREGSHLVPVSSYDEELIRSLPSAATLSIQPKQERSWRQNRFYHAMVDLAAENTDYYATRKRDLRNYIKIKLGLYNSMRFHDGTIHFDLKSTAFHKMDGIEFGEFVDKALGILANEIIGGSKGAEFLREVEARTGDRLHDIQKSMGNRDDPVRR